MLLHVIMIALLSEFYFMIGQAFIIYFYFCNEV